MPLADSTGSRERTRTRAVEAIRLTAVVIGTCLWVVYCWTIFTPSRFDRFGAVKGWDFPQFYVNGRLVAEGQVASLYDTPAVSAATTAYVSDRVPYVYNVYGPHVSLLFSPLGSLSYGWALAVWLCVSAGLYTWSCRVLVTPRKSHTRAWSTLAMVLAASPAWWLTVQYGQLSAALLAMVCAAMVLHGHRQRFAAGVVLGLLVAKPQLLLPAAVVLVFAGEAQIIAGLAASATLQVGITVLVMGTGPLVEYARMVMSFGDLASTLQAKRHLLQSLSAFWGLLLPASPLAATVLAVGCGVLALAMGVAIWRRESRGDHAEAATTLGWIHVESRWSAVLCATMLVSPHFYVYDLLLLSPVIALLLQGVWPKAAAAGTSRGTDHERAALEDRGESWRARAEPVCGMLLFLAPLVSTFAARNWSLQLTTPIVAGILLLRFWRGWRP